MEKRICKRCNLENEERQARTGLAAYVANMDEEIKADEELYQKRLSLCKNCEKQINSLCMMCGCFIEVRAAVREQYCPMPVRKW